MLADRSDRRGCFIYTSNFKHLAVLLNQIRTGMDYYLKEVFDALDFIAFVTVHIPPKHKQYIRRYGRYSSRTRSKWVEQEHLVRLSPEGGFIKGMVFVGELQETC